MTTLLTARCTIDLPADPPEWVHLLPAGSVEAVDGRAWTLADPAAVVRASAGRDLVVDYEHQTDLAEKNGQPAPAAGWVKGLAAREDGIWGRVEWTDRAAAHIRAREYRFLSPTFTYSSDGQVVRLLRAALTNDPALTLTALARREDRMADANPPTTPPAPPAPTTPPATAAPPPATPAVPSPPLFPAMVMPDLTVALARLDSLEQQVALMKAERAEAQATAIVDTAIAAHLATPGERDNLLALARTQPDQVRAMLAARVPVLAPPGTGGPSALPPGGGTAGGALTADELALCRKLGITDEAYAKAKSGECKQ